MLPKRQDYDAYENHLTTLLEQTLDAASTAHVRVSFDGDDSRRVCRVAVQPSPSPVWTKVKGQEEVFYVRLNNSTRPLGPRQAFEYISQHFRGAVARRADHVSGVARAILFPATAGSPRRQARQRDADSVRGL